MTSTERRTLIDDIRSLPDMLAGSIAGLSDEQLDTPYREGGWTVRQVVHHIADSHLNGYARMKLIVTEEHPTLKPYDQDEWAALQDSRLDPVLSLDILRGLHERWRVLLEHIPEESWDRTAFHPEDGEVSLEGLLNVYAGHGQHHVRQIDALKQRLGW